MSLYLQFDLEVLSLFICHSGPTKALKYYQPLCQIMHSRLSVFPSTFCEASLGSCKRTLNRLKKNSVPDDYSLY